MTNSTALQKSDSKPTKCTWKTATQNNIVVLGNNNMIDWSDTKYYNRKDKEVNGFNNFPPDHLAANLQDKFISYECPGIVANKMFEFSYDNNNKCFRFIPNKEYTHAEISNICGGVFYGVLSKTENTIQVTYKPYDHKNEPIITEEFILTDADNEENQ